MNVDIGSKVKKGEVMALIDAPEINSHVQEMNERVRAAEARYKASKDYFERINAASQANGVIAPSEYQRVRDQFLADSSDYRSTLLAASALHQTGEYLTIVAPFPGIITKRNIITGSFVGNNNDKPLFELEDNSTLRLQVAVPEIYTSALLLNNSGELTTRSLPDKQFKAKLARKADIIDNSTRTETWEFEIPNGNGELIAGSYADVRLHFIRHKSGFILPSSAIATTLERKFVIRVRNDLTQWVDVRAGFNMGDKQEIFGDLKAGDTLLLKHLNKKPGQK
jgi:RND family efflux transporter MFP subunit